MAALELTVIVIVIVVQKLDGNAKLVGWWWVHSVTSSQRQPLQIRSYPTLPTQTQSNANLTMKERTQMK